MLVGWITLHGFLVYGLPLPYLSPERGCIQLWGVADPCMFRSAMSVAMGQDPFLATASKMWYLHLNHPESYQNY